MILFATLRLLFPIAVLTCPGHLNPAFVFGENTGCAVTFALENICDFEKVYPRPAFTYYYPLINMSIPEAMTCFKYSGSYVTNTSIVCMCGKKDCHEWNNVESSLKDIKALPVDESEARDDDLKTYGDCLLRRFFGRGVSEAHEAETTSQLPSSEEGESVFRHSSKWEKRFSEDPSTSSSWLSSGYAILVVTFIYIVIAVAFFITFSCSHSKPSQAR